jgi:hypothetical protein
METRVAPDAFRRAETVREVGLGVTGTLSVASGVLLVVLGMAMYVAAGLGIGPFLPDLPAMVLLGAYAAVAPGAFARLSRATAAPATARRLVTVVLGYATGWAVLMACLV